jgi:uncharacterized membrane protein
MMSSNGDARVDALEEELRALSGRVAKIESALGVGSEWTSAPSEPSAQQPPAPAARPRTAPAFAPPEPLPPRPPAPPRRPRQEIDLEELLGGRLLALVGGLAVILGLAFLVALAVERGWLDESARTGLAFLGSAALLVVGAWLHERRGRTQASLAVVGTGLAGLFLSLSAATVLYDLVAVELALGAAFVFGAVGAALAIRWDAEPIGGLGILGALAAPILTGATANAQSLLFLAVAYAAAVAVLTWRRWEWMRVAAVGLVLFEIGGWVLQDEPSVTRGFVVLALFGALSAIAALGFEVRCSPRTRASCRSLAPPSRGTRPDLSAPSAGGSSGSPSCTRCSALLCSGCSRGIAVPRSRCSGSASSLRMWPSSSSWTVSRFRSVGPPRRPLSPCPRAR